MGLELIIGGISAIFSIFNGIQQADAANRAAGEQARAAAAQREANAIQAAGSDVQASDSRRQRIRENRIRRAQIMAASENQGTSRSSGETGALGALNTNLGTMFSSSLGESKTNSGINANMQRAADYNSNANTILAQSQATSSLIGGIQNGLTGFGSIFKK